MATRITIPDMGQTTDELTLGRWCVAVGDEVAVGDVLAEIETDKAVAELESYAAGHVLALLAEEGDAIHTGDGLLWIGRPGEPVGGEPEDVPDARPAHEEARRGAEQTARQAGPAEPGLLATPAARTVARERGVAIGAIPGSGPEGCVVRRDVLAHAEGGRGEGVRGGSVPLSAMRRALASRLQRSVREAPHYYVAVDVDVSRALELREASTTKLSINDLIVKAAGDALAEVPAINCRVEGEVIHYLRDANVGIAVSLEDGLLAPVLERVDTLSLAEVASRSRKLIDSARAGTVRAGPVAGLTVSNLGMYGVKWFTAIINPPEVAILAVGAVEDRLALTPSGVVARPALTLTLSCDHRIVDGVLAARFLGVVKRRLEGMGA